MVTRSDAEVELLCNCLTQFGRHAPSCPRWSLSDATAEQRVKQLEAAIQHAIVTLGMAYEAAEKKFNDETLLHLGALQARLTRELNRR